jgi:hypothetical protein
MNRAEILQTADRYVNADREAEYGSPEQNFKVIAELWNVYLTDRVYPLIKPEDVANMMALLKIGRIASGHKKADNYIDLAGYAAIAGELATRYMIEEGGNE